MVQLNNRIDHRAEWSGALMFVDLLDVVAVGQVDIGFFKETPLGNVAMLLLQLTLEMTKFFIIIFPALISSNLNLILLIW